MSAVLERLRPTRAELVDGAFALVLATLAVLGFRSAFGGVAFLVAGVVGAILGVVLAHLVRRFRLAILPAAAAVLAAVVVVGMPVVAWGDTVLGLPTAEAFRSFADGLVRGWARLLTTLPPTGGIDHLLAVPYVCGLVAGFGGALLAGATRSLALVVLPSAAALITGFLFGTSEPVSLLLQGSLYAVVALAWMSVRRGADATVVVAGNRRAVRTAGALGMLVVAGLGATVVGPRLPFAGADDRTVLRDEVVPPFDPHDYGSPLAAFRRYRVDLEDQVLLTVDAVPEGVTRIRLATMDDYDNLVWNVGGGGRRGAGYFERTGEQLPVEPDGEEFTAEVTIGALRGVWVPQLGRSTAVAPAGDRAGDLAASLRYNAASGMLATPAGLAEGDRWRLSGVVEVLPDEQRIRAARIDTAVVEGNLQLPPDFGSFAALLVTGAANPYDQARALERELQQGAYSDGGDEGVVLTPPGHSAGRLVRFIDGQLVGNGEQYAATMAVLARTLSLPARVVMGFEVEPGATDVEIAGADVDAWVEIAFEDIGWVPFFPTPPETNEPQPEVVLQRPQPRVETQLPPPVSNPPTPSTLPPLDDEVDDPPEREVEQPGSGGLPVVVLVSAVAIGGPLLLALVFVGGVVLVKRRRRSRRRSRGEPHRRIAGGWQEVLDVAVDHGHDLPARGTRREVAAVLGSSAPQLASSADAKVFGREEPTADEAAEFWSAVDTTVRDLGRDRSTLDRVRASASLRSLRRHRGLFGESSPFTPPRSTRTVNRGSPDPRAQTGAQP